MSTVPMITCLTCGDVTPHQDPTTPWTDTRVVACRACLARGYNMVTGEFEPVPYVVTDGDENGPWEDDEPMSEREAYYADQVAPTNVAPFFREANRASGRDGYGVLAYVAPVAPRDVWSGNAETDKMAYQERAAHVWRTVTRPRLTY